MRKISDKTAIYPHSAANTARGRLRAKVGYNSYSSRLRPIQEIYENEAEKGNESVLRYIEKAFPTGESRKSVGAIWVEYNPLTCFRRYVLDADHYGDSASDILRLYPGYMSEVHKVDLSGLTLIFGDQYAGYLYADKKGDINL